jgi:hypothetical protein
MHSGKLWGKSRLVSLRLGQPFVARDTNDDTGGKMVPWRCTQFREAEENEGHVNEQRRESLVIEHDHFFQFYSTEGKRFRVDPQVRRNRCRQNCFTGPFSSTRSCVSERRRSSLSKNNDILDSHVNTKRSDVVDYGDSSLPREKMSIPRHAIDYSEICLIPALMSLEWEMPVILGHLVSVDVFLEESYFSFA